QRRQAADRHVAAVGVGAERAVAVLLVAQVGQALLDGLLGVAVDHPLGRAAVGQGLTSVTRLVGESQGGAGDAQQRRRLRKETTTGPHGLVLLASKFPSEPEA